jgi:hypothetical protein
MTPENFVCPACGAKGSSALTDMGACRRCLVRGAPKAALSSGEAWATLQRAAEDYTKGYDVPGTAPDAEARLRAAAVAYAATPFTRADVKP